MATCQTEASGSEKGVNKAQTSANVTDRKRFFLVHRQRRSANRFRSGLSRSPAEPARIREQETRIPGRWREDWKQAGCRSP